MKLVDAHLDLAMNALVLNRDLTKSAHDTRQDEAERTEKGRAAGTVGFPDLRKAEIGLCLATVLARVNPKGSSPLDFRTHEIAHAHAQGELALYREFARQGKMRLITTREGLANHVEMLNSLPDGPIPEDNPLGYVMLMEGADPIVTPDRAEQWFADGLRVVGPAHYGPSAYAFGTDSAGPLTEKGRQLMVEMDRLGMILDASHLTDESFHDALDRFHGPVLASHSNCRALVAGDRQIDDDMIRRLADRGAVIGAVCDAWMLQPGWVRGETTPEKVTISNVVDHIDHVCQVTGSSRHAAIGSDLDGGYGTEQTPNDLDTIADLQVVPRQLADRGYSDDDIASIMHGNWYRFLGDNLPSGRGA